MRPRDENSGEGRIEAKPSIKFVQTNAEGSLEEGSR